MNFKQKRALQAFRRAHGWLESHPELVADAQRLRRELILYYMRPLATVARVAIPNVVRMSESLRMPSQGKDIEGLLIAADAMAAAALPWQTELEERGLPAGFFDTFDQAVTDLRDAVDTRGQALGLRKGDTNRLRAGVTDGRKHMDAIDALITRELRDDPSTLAEWNHVRRATLKAVPGSATALPTAVAPVPAEASPVPIAEHTLPAGGPPVQVTASLVPVAATPVPVTASLAPVAPAPVQVTASLGPAAASLAPAATAPVQVTASLAPAAASPVPATEHKAA